MTDVIVIAIIASVVFAAAYYVYKAKKSGKKCIGCPEGCSCSTKQGCPSCHCHDTEISK